jgi:hypothetical protein
VTQTAQPAATSAAPAGADRGAWTLALLLTACLTVAYVDRAVLNLLAEPIKRDFGLSDTRLSLLQGLAFTVSFMVATLPAGWLADRMDRRVLISAGVFAWSLMTAACGLAQSFEQLFLARVGVGLFEAVLTPCAVVMIAGAFRPGPRSTAMGIYHMGSVLGIGLSLMLGRPLDGAAHPLRRADPAVRRKPAGLAGDLRPAGHPRLCPVGAVPDVRPRSRPQRAARVGRGAARRAPRLLQAQGRPVRRPTSPA